MRGAGFQGTVGKRLGRSKIPRLGRIGSIVGVVGTFRLGYERGLFLGSAIRVIDGLTLRLSVTRRGSVGGRFGRTEARRSTVGVRSGRVTGALGLAVVGGGVIRRFGREGSRSIGRLGGDTLRLGLELCVGGNALRFGGELRLGGDALRFGGELRLGGEALRFGGELRLGGDALRFGGELRLGGDALRFGGEPRLGGDALRFGDGLRLGGEALRLGVDRDGLAPLLPLRSLPPPSIEAEICDADTPLSSETGPLAAVAGPAAIKNAINVATARVVTSRGQEESCADIALPPAQGSPGYAGRSPRAVGPWAKTPLSDGQFRLTPEKRGRSPTIQPNRHARQHTGGCGRVSTSVKSPARAGGYRFP